MAGKAVEIDCSELERFIEQLDTVGNGALKEELKKYLQALGNEFLRILEEEIIRRRVMDTRLLLKSFHKGNENNVWVLSDGGFTLEIGTNVEYASYVNNGHWTNPKGVKQRFVPGDVVLDTDGKVIEFTYNPNAKTGIMLKQKWVEGTHYLDGAIRTMEKMLPEFLERKLSAWLSNYFGM